MKKFLVKESEDWADEFDVESFKILKGESKKAIISEIEAERETNYPMTFSFGTNEEVEVQDREELESFLTFKEISDEEVKVFKKFFPDIERYAFGTNAIL